MATNAKIQIETYDDGTPIRSQYLRVREVLKFYPLRKSMLYQLMRSGKIKSFVIKHRSAQRGIRLIDRDSLDLYLKKEAEKSKNS